MSVQVYLVAETLQRMEQQGAMIRPHAVTIATAIHSDQYSTALQASEELNRALKAFVEMSARVRDHVVASDGMGELGQSAGELALRARSFVLTSLLDVLCGALQEARNRLRTSDWFAGKLKDVAALRIFILDKLRAIHGTWLPYRAGQPQPGMLESERTTTYRLMVRIAQRRLCELRDDPDVARFLLNGVQALDLPTVNLACKHIDMVLGLEIDLEPGRPANRRRARIGTPPGVPEQR